MGSETARQLPKVDFSAEGLVPGSHGWEVVRGQVREALETYGCFEAVYDGVPPELREAVIGAMKELFALPLETKLRNLDPYGYAGYIGQFSSLAYESLGFYTNLPQGAQRFTDLMWPQGIQGFCETVHGYAKKLVELDRIVRRMVMESLGVEKYYESEMESTDYFLRMSEYGRDTQPEEAKLGLSPHVDPNLSSIIYQNEVGGLEVLTEDGDWVPFAPVGPNSFVVMGGASFMAWSNGRLRAPVHRVTCGAGNKTRYSVLLNMVPKNEGVVETPEELVDEEHPRLFRPYKYIDYLNYTLSPNQPQGKCLLHAYCGIEGTKA